MAKLTKEQWRQSVDLVEALSDPANQPWDPEFGEALMTAATRAFALTAVEAVALRRGADGWEVLLAQRPNQPTEPYPGQWHSPGTFVYAADTTTPDAQLARLVQREIAPARYAKAVFAGKHIAHTPPRGRILQDVYAVRIEGDPGKGKFFPVNALPVPFHEQHHKIIAIAVKKAEELDW